MSNAKRILKTYSCADTVGTKKNGNLLLRWGFYYTHGKTAEDYTASMQKLISEHGLQAEIVDSGKVWTNFRGGASLAASSHFWVEIKIAA